jgi:ribokinase
VEHVARGLAGLGRGDTVIAQAEIPAAALSVVIEAVSRQGMALYLDPTPPVAASDVNTPDLAEAAALVGRTGESHLVPALAARELVESGARRVVIKLGADGSIMATADEPVIHVPTLEVDAVDETGAGDVFLAALAVRRSEGAAWLDAIAFANAASAISVSQPGLTLPDRRTVERRRAQ